MAGVAMMVGGAIVNAFAFSGSNFLFSMFGNRRIDEERKRHDLAIEQLQRARDRLSKTRTERLDFINETLRKQQHVVDIDSAMQEYSMVTEENLELLDKERVLSDFYTPSQDQMNREMVFITLGMGTTGLINYQMFY